MKETFKIEKYSAENLLNIMLEASPLSSKGIMGNKLHFTYFKEYFEKIKVKTILIEYNYVDHDYLEDYQAYYVRCFEEYKRYTTRLHFFSEQYGRESFNSDLVNGCQERDKKLQASYCGFIVIKPLAQTIIGRTCLKTYPVKDNREYTVLRKYKINLFGLSLIVNSLAFQEQDGVVSACATSALWSCFQATGKLFQHDIPSPVVITKEATANGLGDSASLEVRTFPNKGLVFSEMDLAIRERGLETTVISVIGRNHLNRLVYAYLRCEIPLLLICSLHDKDKEGSVNSSSEGTHAVAVTGYNFFERESESSSNNFFLIADRIDKLFVHDDRVGPFARMVWEENKNWLSVYSSSNKKSVAKPTMIILPLYHKIRIPFGYVYDAISSLDKLQRVVQKEVDEKNPVVNIKWDIYLTKVSDFKGDLRLQESLLGSEQLLEILSAPLPKYLWRVSAKGIKGEYLFELIFDATGVAQGNLLVAAPIAVESTDAIKVINIIRWLKPEKNMDVLTNEIISSFC